MKWTLFVALALLGVVAGTGAWKEHQEYKYKLVIKTFVKKPEWKKEIGTISSVLLTIRPQSDNLLIGQITEAGADRFDPNRRSDIHLALDVVLQSKPFKIHLKNGVIDSLSVDRELASDEIDALKFVVSQFQLDTKAQNVIASDTNHLPVANSNNAFYMTMEPIVTGECETTYDISRLPEYLVYANRESIPLPKLDGEGDIIQIVKNTNYKNCNKRTRYLLDVVSQSDDVDTNNQMDNNSTESLYSRILITGSLNDYTIQSSAATSKVDGLTMYVYLTLESVEPSSDYNPRFGNLENIGSLVYTNDARKNEYRQDDTEDRSFGGRPKYSRCAATYCFSKEVLQDQLCARAFGDRLPITMRTSSDCAPGFWRGICCPRSFE